MHFSFFEAFKGPVHTKKWVSASPGIPASGGVTLTADWKLIVPPEASAQIMIAATDLKECLRIGAGVDVQVVPAEGFLKPSKQTIVLCTVPQLFPDMKPESYRLVCNPEGIRIEGADDSGVMQGVFYLEALMKFQKAPWVAFQDIRRSPWLETRILRSPMAFYYQEELEQIREAYPDNYLLKLAHQGVNGIWLRGILRELVKLDFFPEFGTHSDRYLRALNELIARCRPYGIKVFFYFTEPLGFPADGEFFKKYPHLRGEYLDRHAANAFCSSTREVKAYLEQGMRYLVSHAKGLGGVICITATEHLNHCYSHHYRHSKPMTCPRCRERTPQDVVTEILALIHAGVKAADPAVKVIAWNWSWAMYEDDPQRGIIEKLLPEIILMADFERGGRRQNDGLEYPIDEYSLTYVGPSSRFQGAVQAGHQTGHRVYAKLQIGVTHEIGTVPWLPVLQKLALKFIRLHREQVTGAMECWDFGNILSRNTELAYWLSWEPMPADADQLLKQIAERDFGRGAADMVIRAWRHFCDATDHFPFTGAGLYSSPVNHGGAYPLFLEKQNRPMPSSWMLPKEVAYNAYFRHMENKEYGDELSFCGAFGPEGMARCFNVMGREWEKGVALLKKVLEHVPPEYREAAEQEYAVAAAIRSQFASAEHFIEFTHLRNGLAEAKDPKQRETTLDRLTDIARAEMTNARFLKALALKEPLLGFHGEGFGYFYTPEKIDRKLAHVQQVLDRDIPACRHARGL